MKIPTRSQGLTGLVMLAGMGLVAGCGSDSPSMTRTTTTEQTTAAPQPQSSKTTTTTTEQTQQ